MHNNQYTDLPTAIATYLAAHDARDVATASSEYTYTTEYVGATAIGEAGFDVVQHLEGDFPGGVADLHFRFTLDRGLISRLVIEP